MLEQLSLVTTLPMLRPAISPPRRGDPDLKPVKSQQPRGIRSPLREPVRSHIEGYIGRRSQLEAQVEAASSRAAVVGSAELRQARKSIAAQHFGSGADPSCPTSRRLPAAHLSCRNGAGRHAAAVVPDRHRS